MTTLLAIIPFLLLGHLFSSPARAQKEGRLHFFFHSLYAISEPTLLWGADLMLRNRFFTQTRLGRFLLWWFAYSGRILPHGVCVSTDHAINLIRHIEKISGPKVHVAVGPCVCQKATRRYKEPVYKDITIWYGAEIYQRHYPDLYRMITADEAVAILQDCHRAGLAHFVEFCMQSKSWMFVLCNCDSEICCPKRFYDLTGRVMLPGPSIAQHDPRACLGPEKCGVCLQRCPFDANRLEPGRVRLDPAKCLGCGLCVTTCPAAARRLTPRPDYDGRLLPLDYVQE